MERRSFIKKLFGGAAAVAVVAAVPAVAETCDCALRSFWDGPCPKHSTQTLGDYAEYADYSSFSRISLSQSERAMVDDAARELAYRAGLSMNQLWEQTFDTMRS